jgi:hypothetical protein
MDILEGMNLVAKIGLGMFAIEMLVADSPVYDWKAVFVISKAILAKAMLPGGALGLYGFERSRRRIRYNEAAHNSVVG